MIIGDIYTSVKCKAAGAHRTRWSLTSGPPCRWQGSCAARAASLPHTATPVSSCSGGHVEQCLHHLPNFGRARLLPPTLPKFFLQQAPLQGLAAIGIRCAPLLLIPRGVTAVAQLRERLVPCPPLHDRVTPQTPVERSLVGPPVAQLLLARPLDLLHVLEGLLDRRPARHGLQDVLDRRLRVRAEVRQPDVVLLDQHHPDHTPSRLPGRQEGLDRLRHVLLILEARHLLPALGMAGALRQTEPPLAVGGGAAAAAPTRGAR